MSRKVPGVATLLAAILITLSVFAPALRAADPSNVDDLVKQADKAMQDGKYKAALAALDQAITAAPGRADLYGLRARVNDERNDVDKALDDIKKMMELAPNDATAYMIRAKINMGRQKFDEALADANAAIERAPKNPDAYYLRSDVYNDMGKTAESKADEAKASSLER
jgi:tetratricopeptide (TPR) repeat protein